MKQKHICNYVGCGTATYGRYCIVHTPIADARQKQHMKQADIHRGSAASRGYDGRWKVMRKQYLMDNPLCVECHKQGKYITANVVDHITPHKGNAELFNDESNWQALCNYHHCQKTMTELRSSKHEKRNNSNR